jgi:condensation enzyme
MTQTTEHPKTTLNQFPLSSMQEWLCNGDPGDPDCSFKPQFTSYIPVRITGHVDVAALQGALDDLVRRHEILRTVIVRETEPRYQQIYPPTQATLRITDIPPSGAESRDVQAQEFITSVGRRGMDVRTLPLLRADLGRFDDQDSVLILCSHHTAIDGWSQWILIHELAAFYKARTTGSPADLPDAPQYRDYVTWERDRYAGPDAEVALKYWRNKLSGGQIFMLPADYPVTGIYTRPFSAYYSSIDRGVTEEAAKLSKTIRASMFMVLLAAFNVLTHEITGTTDPVINTFYSGRADPKTHNIIGPTVNVVPLRTTIDSCVTFRDVVERTRRTCLEAYYHEIPRERIEAEAPDLMKPVEDPMLSNFFVFSMPQPHVDDNIDIADGAYVVRKEVVEDELESTDLGGGFVWDMDLLRDGELTVTVRFNLDEFDLQTVKGWVAAYNRVLSRVVADPDREWKKP